MIVGLRHLKKWGERIRAAIAVLRNRFPSSRVLSFTESNLNFDDASSEIVTLMFVDISGFSIIAEDLTPSESFAKVSPILSTVIDTISSNGGFVEKTIGDGVFAYFRDGQGRFRNDNHADRAIQSALSIQNKMMNENISKSQNEDILPLRIGINTASVCLGKIATQNFIEFTLIGRGVNYAQRLEQACDIYSIMIAESTVDLATKYTPKSEGISRKMVKVKNQTGLLNAFEFNPFYHKPLILEKALENFRQSRNLQRTQERINVPQESTLEFNSAFGGVQLIDFSKGGLSIGLEKYLAKNVDLEIPIEDGSHEFAAELRERGIEKLLLRVKWGKVDDELFIHGAKLLNLSDSQRDFLFECFESHVYNPTRSGQNLAS